MQVGGVPQGWSNLVLAASDQFRGNYAIVMMSEMVGIDIHEIEYPACKALWFCE